jgi:hypothetical protein
MSHRDLPSLINTELKGEAKPHRTSGGKAENQTPTGSAFFSLA